jgi:aminobenzoyl-glutamate utilization protein B
MREMKEGAWNWIDENRGRLIEISDAIWDHAELGLMEEKSSKLLADELETHGFNVERGVAGMPTAFVASWGRGKPVIAVLGEFYALPGISQKKVPYRDPLKEGAPGHGCGHNIHGVSARAPGSPAPSLIMPSMGPTLARVPPPLRAWREGINSFLANLSTGILDHDSL